MQVRETKAEGLKREIEIVVPASDLEARLQTRLYEIKDQVKLKGFRPGKVPMSHMRKSYGRSVMAEIVNQIINETPRSVIAERNERSAMQPEIQMTEDEGEAEKVLRGESDFRFTVAYETLPSFDLKETDGIKIERPVVEIGDDEVEDQVKRIAESARTYQPKDGAAENGDRVTMDFVGKVDGEAFQGGSAEDSNLVLGSGQFIPGFEDQLVGVKAGDEKTVNVKFPEDYGAAHLAGKDAEFAVTVKAVAAPDAMELDDELAKKLGLESIARLREIVRGQIESQFGQATRQKVKRQLLDQLDAEYSFELPEKLVEAEFNNIWNQVSRELEQSGKSFEDEDTTEEKARAEYRKLAERRVRLGLVLSEIGEKAGVTVSDEELQRAVIDQVRQYPGQEQQVYDYFRKTPEAIQSLRAPIYEEKVVDHLLSTVAVTDKTVSKDELMKDDEDELSSAA
ncbi:trigger factor [Aureimonas phyllosphaerae]|uniref:Trigger factor n=1 Tax=Aureimonas phyllosphaerae TaxID=1166078 RepID=A0A7W6FTK2_9HYPH|nr:trigger factor [Aureimonas phyllosphaerae]MBB3935086.1 trigger factor [Aureimonas phyllosphaerae]MBB3959094.1 trigger factor [Aureimonas phyllosphaerae]SFF08021.1 trigger factor [Aureimonas phyllosphaerae]